MRALLDNDFRLRFPLTYSVRERDTEWGREASRLFEEWVAKSLDPLTGLLTRGTWFQFLESAILRVLSPLSERVGTLQQTDLLRATDTPFFLLVGDMAYLSLANKGGHASGDLLLSGVGGAIREQLVGHVCGRLGGDEIGAFVENRSTQQLIAEVSELEAAIKVIRHDYLLTWGLSPQIDIGVATLEEVGRYLYEPFREGERGLLRNVVDTLVAVADCRSAYVKCVERLKELARHLLADPALYSEKIGFLGKGANNPRKRDIRALARLLEKGKFDDLHERACVMALKGFTTPLEQFALRVQIAPHQ